MRLIIFVIILLNTSPDIYCQDHTEYNIKSAFVVNFLHFTEFPNQTYVDKQISFCVSSKTAEVLEAFKSLNGTLIADSTLSISTLQPNTKINTCEVIFIARDSTLITEKFHDTLKQTGTLIITDDDIDKNTYSIIQFVTIDKKIRFEINLTKAGAHGIIFSSKLLKLAHIIEDN
jgi:YfiR/HmsC-like